MRRTALVATFVAAACAIAVAEPRDKSRADKLFDDGRRYLTNKEYALACTAFEQSQEADPAIGTQLNIALCYEEWGHVASAYRAYQSAERLAHGKLDAREKHAHKKMEELAPQVPHLVIDVPDDADPSAVLLFDDKIIERTALADDLLVDAGAHTFEMRLSGQPLRKTTIDIKNGDHKRIKIDVPKPQAIVVNAPPPPPPPSKRRLYTGFGLVGSGVVLIAVAGGVSLIARSDYSTALADCPGGVCKTKAAFDATQSARTKGNYMTVVTGAGVALAAVGIYYLVTSHRDDEQPKHAVAPFVTSDAIGLSIGGEL